MWPQAAAQRAAGLWDCADPNIRDRQGLAKVRKVWVLSWQIAGGEAITDELAEFSALDDGLREARRFI
jgi:hypothetical protein